MASLPTFTFARASPTPTSSDTSDSDSDWPGSPGSIKGPGIYVYPSILLILLAVASIYVCNVLSKRRENRAARQAAALSAVNEKPPASPEKPEMYEAYMPSPVDLEKACVWKDVMPISTTVLRAFEDAPPTQPVLPTPPPPSLPRRRSFFLFHKPRRPDPAPPSPPPGPPPQLLTSERITTAVFIAMPSLPKAKELVSDDESSTGSTIADALPELVLGSEEIPWHSYDIVQHSPNICSIDPCR